MDDFLRVRDLRKGYGEGGARIEVLEGIDIDVGAGELCALLGPSGSGKSTFLNLVGGLEQPDGGTIVVGDTSLTELSGRGLDEYRRDSLGFVFQFYNLVPDLTVRENIEVCAYLSPEPLPMDELLESLGLWDHRDKFPSQVSGGQQQRCAIGRALVKAPRLLLCDEPTGALDYKTSKEILQLMEDVNQRYGCTMVIVTHNEAIQYMSHRVLQLRDGQIVSEHTNQTIKPASELSW